MSLPVAQGWNKIIFKVLPIPTHPVVPTREEGWVVPTVDVQGADGLTSLLRHDGRVAVSPVTLLCSSPAAGVTPFAACRDKVQSLCATAATASHDSFCISVTGEQQRNGLDFFPLK